MDNELYEKERHQASQDMGNTVSQEISEEAVLNDENFVNSYGKVAAYLGKEIKGTNQQDLAKEGLQFISDMIIPLTTLDNEGLVGLGQLALDADPETKQAMSYMYNTVENKETTWNGFARGLKSVGKDPSLYAGVATGGWGFFGREAAKSAVKRTLGTMLVSGMATSGYMGAEEAIVQEVEDIEGDKPTDWGKVQEMTTMGALFGLAMPLAFEGGARAVGVTGKAIGAGIEEGIEAIRGGNILSFGNGDTVGGALGGGFAGGTEALYEDMIENKDLSVEDYLARIGAGAAMGAGLGKKYGGKGGTKMFVGAKPDEPGAFSNVYDKGVRKWIDDTPANVTKTSGAGFMSQVLDHPELYKQYPELKRVKVEFKEMEEGKLGSFMPESNKIVLNKNLSEDEVKSVLLHETQHGVQGLENWARGGSPEEFMTPPIKAKWAEKKLVEVNEVIKEKTQELNNDLLDGKITKDEHKKLSSEIPELKEADKLFSLIDKGEPSRKYKSLAGEQEARATQAALDEPGIDPYKALEKKEGKLPEPIVKKKDK